MNPKSEYRARTELPPESSFFNAPHLSLTVTRRDTSALLAAGILLTFHLHAEEDDSPSKNPNILSSRLLFHPNQSLTLLTGKAELGQGSRTVLAQAAAEELDLPLSSIRVLMADTQLTPDDGGTWASLTCPQTVPTIRKAAAAARALFLASKSPSYYEWAQSLTQSPTLHAAPETLPQNWKILGTSPRSANALAIVTGSHRFPSDLRQPNLLHARVLRPPHHLASLTSAEGPNLIRHQNLIAVTAPSSAALPAAASAIKAAWKPQPLPSNLWNHLVEASNPPRDIKGARYPELISHGDALALLAQSQRKLLREYRLPYIAHVPLEPRACIALFQNSQLTIWTGSQAPFLARQDVAKATGLPESSIRILVSDPGSGYGGKQRGELESEAARIALARPNQPIRLAWSREEEFERAYLRPAGVLRLAAALDGQGLISAFEHRNYNSGASGLKPVYDFPNTYCAFHSTPPTLRQGSYRSLAAVANTWAREMLMSEAAHETQTDPLEFRLRHTRNPRLRAVADAAATRFQWTKRPQPSGLSLNFEKDAALACCIQIDPTPGKLRVTRAVIAADFGAALNPDNLKNQIQGAFIQSLGGALFEQIRFDATRVLNPRLSRYRVPRFLDVPPQLDIILIDRRDLPSAGAGESPITLAAPAIGAALHAATGKWPYQLPMDQTE